MVISQICSLYRDANDLLRPVIKRVYEENTVERNSFFLFFCSFCLSLILSNAPDAFAQTDRGMQIIVHTKSGKEIPLYNKSYALVVGNGTYTNGWDSLNGALKDVDEVATELKKHGFNVTLKKDLRKAAFETAFEAFIRNGRRDENSRLLFYYAGQGYTETLRTGAQLGYLVMVDSPLPTTAGEIDGSKNIDMESLVTQAKRIDALHVLYVLDSCFSGSILNARNVPNPPAIQDSIRYPVRQFITAGRAEQPVPDHSVFKTAFLDILAGRVEEPIRDGYITGEELGLYLRNAVSRYNPAQTPQYGKINDPSLDKGDFVFVIQQKIIKWTGTFTVVNTWSLRVEPVLPSKQTVVLSLESDPSRAEVYINNVRIGQTPLTDHEMSTREEDKGLLKVRIEHEGYDSTEVVLAASQQIIEQGSSEMVLIPAGEFQMGSNDGDDDEKPVHTVYVDAFYMDKYEVTVGQYKEFIRATRYRAPNWNKVAEVSPTDRHPMIYVSL